MDHAEARERLELAALEPGGLERLMAGDTADAAAIAGHLAGCEACADELRRLHAAAGLIRRVVQGTPSPGLRGQTLAYVETLGRARGPAAAAAEVALGGAGGAETGRSAEPARRRAQRKAAPARWIAALAAAIVVAIGGTMLVTGVQRDAELERRADAVAALERVAAMSLRVAAQPDAAQVALAPTGAPGAESADGTLMFSPGTHDLVVIAAGLPRPPDGREFRCWVESGGERRNVGRMYFTADLSFWIGSVDAVADLRPGSRFGITLVDAAGGALDGDPALVGDL